MARPNNGKTSHTVVMKVHINLKRLLEARREFLKNDGQKFVKKVPLTDISEEFVEHYFKDCSTFPYTSIMADMKRAYKVTKSNQNI